MKIKLLVLITLLSFSTTFSQSFDKLLFSKKDKPTVIINDNIIANWNVIEMMPNGAVQKMDIVKKNPLNEQDNYTKTYPNLTEYGLMLYTADAANIETKTLQEIRSFFDADLKTKIYVDGYLLMKESYLVATKSITEIEYLKPNEQDFNEDKIINVWTLTKEARFGTLTIPRTVPFPEKKLQ